MGNTFKSLVAAAGILAAGDATNAQEGADSTANKTKQALVELLSELPPGFDSARKVIEWDITLAGDGDLSDSDKLAIEGHMWKLATVIPESARKVREAMTGVETIVAADQDAPLNESPEDEKLRKEEEKKVRLMKEYAEKFNKWFLDSDNWSYNPKNSGIGVIKKIPGTKGMSIEFKEGSVRTQNEDSYVWAWFQIVPGEYMLMLDAKNLSMTATFKNGQTVLWQHNCTNWEQVFTVPEWTSIVSFANRNAPVPDTARKTEIYRVLLSPMEKTELTMRK